MSAIERTLHAARAQLAPVSPSPSLDAHMLLGAVLGAERAYLLAHGEVWLTPEQQRRFDDYVARRANGEPVAYILGRRVFYDRDILVSDAVLIPRPETELLLERALEFVSARPRSVVVDVGTGSGALAVTLAAHAPEARVYATDISAAALAVARRNARAHRVDVAFMRGDLLQPLIERSIEVDVLLANLPYIATGELAQLEVSHHEPRLALDGGVDGLDAIRRLLAQASAVCKPAALALLEIGARQGAAALELARAALHPQSVEIVRDYAGHDRILRVRR